MSTSPTIAELRAVCQPSEVLDRRNAEHWAGRLYMRRLSIYATWALVRACAPANAVTGGMLFVGLGGTFLFSRPGFGNALAGFGLIQLYLLLDCSDGEVARWTRTTGATGIYLDRLGHYAVEAALLVALGLRAAHFWFHLEGFQQPHYDRIWMMWALAAAVVHLIGKAETDLVEVARAKAGLAPNPDIGAVARPRSDVLALLRWLAGVVPVHRLTGAVEASFLVLAAAALDRGGAEAFWAQRLTLAFFAVAAYVAVGHLVMILASNRLRA